MTVPGWMVSCPSAPMGLFTPESQSGGEKQRQDEAIVQQWREPGSSVCAHVCMRVRAGGKAGVGRALEARF